MFTATFYSYKGGVGRTMALANTAHRLSARGKRVFLLDFDLEAPGLDVFFKDDSNRPGLVEYIAHYLDSGVVPPLADFVSEMATPAGSERRGRVFSMRAGKGDDSYQERLARLNWKDFYTQSHGFLFIENLKGAIQESYSPDYLLVDSRTGLTDVSGICTIQVPNLVVFLFALNDQNLRGTAGIYRSVLQNRMSRPIDTLLVASPVPDDATYVGLREQRLSKARDYFARDIDLILPFAPYVAFEETILSHKTETHLSDAYDRLTEKILDTNKSDVLTLLKEVRRIRKEGDPELTEAKYRQIIEAFPDNPQVWGSYGIFLRASRKPEAAAQAFLKAIEFKGGPNNYAELASTLLVMGDEQRARENFYKFLEHSTSLEHISTYTERFDSRGQTEPAIAGYERLLHLCKDQKRAVEPLGALGNIYMRANDPARAVAFYRRAQELMPNQLAITFNLARALQLLGQMEEARTHFGSAVQIYEQTQTVQSIPAARANIMQGMGLSYMALGILEKAERCLVGALEVARLIGTPIFSALPYREVSPEEFRKDTRKILDQLGRITEVPKEA
jgi:tetratricopeptide (TPR) repeat protein